MQPRELAELPEDTLDDARACWAGVLHARPHAGDQTINPESLARERHHVHEHFSNAAIYRTIKLLQDAGIVQRVLVEGESAYYQLVYGRRPDDLIIRMDTGQVISVSVPELTEIRDRLCAERGLKAKGHRFQVFAVGED